MQNYRNMTFNDKFAKIEFPETLLSLSDKLLIYALEKGILLVRY